MYQVLVLDCKTRPPSPQLASARKSPCIPGLPQRGVGGHGSLSVSFGVGADLFLESLAHFVLFDIEIVLSLKSKPELG